MRVAEIGMLVGLCAAVAPSPGRSAFLYAAEADGASSLYEMHPASGAVTAVGPIGHAVLGLAVHPQTATLYGITPLSDPDPAHLLTIDPVTGDREVVDDPLFALVIESAADLTFSSDGTLYGGLEES